MEQALSFTQDVLSKLTYGDKYMKFIKRHNFNTRKEKLEMKCNKLPNNLITSQFCITIMHPTAPLYKLLTEDIQNHPNEIIVKSNQVYYVDSTYFRTLIQNNKLGLGELNDRVYYQLMIDDPQKAMTPYGEWFENFETIDEVIYDNLTFIKPEPVFEIENYTLDTPIILVNFTISGKNVFDAMVEIDKIGAVWKFDSEKRQFGIPALEFLDMVRDANPEEFISAPIRILTHIDNRHGDDIPFSYPIGHTIVESYEYLKWIIKVKLFGGGGIIELKHPSAWYDQNCTIPNKPTPSEPLEYPEISDEMRALYEDTVNKLEDATGLVDIAMDSLQMAGYFNSKCHMLIEMLEMAGADVTSEHSDTFMPITPPLLSGMCPGRTVQLTVSKSRPRPNKVNLGTPCIPGTNMPVYPEPETTTMYHVFIDRYIHIGTNDDVKFKSICKKAEDMKKELKITREKVSLIYDKLNITRGDACNGSET